MKSYADEKARASGWSACKEITYLNYVSSITSGSRIEAASAGGQIVWKEPAPFHLKNRPKFVRTRIRLRRGAL
jgi:hypothetical protein